MFSASPSNSTILLHHVRSAESDLMDQGHFDWWNNNRQGSEAKREASVLMF
jgi:hypothetical protein